MRFVFTPSIAIMVVGIVLLGVAVGASIGITAEDRSEVDTEIADLEQELDQDLANISSGDADSGLAEDTYQYRLGEFLSQYNPLKSYDDVVEPYVRLLIVSMVSSGFTAAIAAASVTSIVVFHANTVLPVWAIQYPLIMGIHAVLLAMVGYQIWVVKKAVDKMS